MKKRILAMLLAVLMCASLMPLSVFAEDAVPAEVAEEELVPEEIIEEPAPQPEQPAEEPAPQEIPAAEDVVEPEAAEEPIEAGTNALTSANFPDSAMLAAVKNSLGVTKMTAAELAEQDTLDISGQNISSLQGIELFTGLRVLHCANNAITAIDLSSNTDLRELYCYGNKLTGLDVSPCASLKILDCHGNSLETITVAEGQKVKTMLATNQTKTDYLHIGWAFTAADAAAGTVEFNGEVDPCICDIPDQTCFYAVWKDNRNILTAEFIPDSGLREAIKYDLGVTEMTPVEAAEQDSLNISGWNIKNLQGLEFFTGLKTLHCADNALTAIDLSSNTDLRELYCYGNKLTELDVSPCTRLKLLDCHGNSLEKITVAGGQKLKTMLATGQLKSDYLHIGWAFTAADAEDGNVDFDGIVDPCICDIPDVTRFYAVWRDDRNILTAVNFPDANLLAAICYDLDVQELTPTEADEITALQLTGRRISSLKGLELFPNLQILDCSGNYLTEVDLTANTELVQLDISRQYNPDDGEDADPCCLGWAFTAEDAADGVIDFNGIVANGDPLPAEMHFYLVEDKNILAPEYMPDAALREAIAAVLETEVVRISEAPSITGLDVSNCGIGSMQGIEYFTGLKTLNCSGNSIGKLDLSANTKLTTLDCSENVLTSLDVSACTKLTRLICSDNRLTSLDVSACTKLVTLSCGQNSLTELDLSANTKLTTLDCAGNKLAALDISMLTALKQLDCSANCLSKLSLSANELLERLDCSEQTQNGFRGWAKSSTRAKNGYIDSTGEKLPAFKVLYAVTAQPTYYVKFNANGGTGTMAKQAHVYGAALELTANAFKRTGYNFAGWNTKANGSGQSYKDEASVKNLASEPGDVVTLYAQWTLKSGYYSITYVLNGGKNKDGNPEVYSTKGASIKLLNPTRTGYTFKGWYTNAECTKSITVIKKGSTGNLKLYAKWQAKEYKITYELKGGKNSSKNPSSYKITTATITLAKPTRTGYIFKGWYSDSACTKKVTEIKKGSTGAITLYAKWQAISYTIAFNANGGTGKMTKLEATYGKTLTLPANAFTRKGYTFQGWAKTKYRSECGIVDFLNSSDVKNLTDSNGGTVTLYAIWKKK